MTIGNQIKMLRLRANLTQSELARLANTTQRMISELENGYETYSFSVLKRIAKALKTDLTVIVPGTKKNR